MVLQGWVSTVSARHGKSFFVNTALEGKFMLNLPFRIF